MKLKLNKIIPFVSLLPILYKNTFLEPLYCNHKNKDETTVFKLHRIDEKLQKYIDKTHPKKRLTIIKENSEIVGEIFKDAKIKTTLEGFTLEDIVNTSPVINPKKIFVASGQDAYVTFREVYEFFVRDFYKNPKTEEKLENESYATLKILTIDMQEIIDQFFLEVEVVSHRNLEVYAFPPKIQKNEREDVYNELKTTIEKIETSVFKSKGDFTEISDLKKLKETCSNFKLLKHANVFRNWPENRYVYKNNNNNFHCIINEEDHLKLQMKVKDDFTDAILNYFDFLEKIETELNFAYDNKLGFLNTLANNLGTGNYFKIKLKTNDKNKDDLSELIKNFDVNDYNIAVEEGQLELSNKHPYINFASLLIDIIGAKEFLVKINQV